MTDNAEYVEVVYALPALQSIVTVAFTPGLTAVAAVERSGLIERYPEIARHQLVLGVWGVGVSLEHCLRPGDRVEISRPLQADPREMRWDLLQGGRVMGGAEAPRVSPGPRVRRKGTG